MIVLAVGTGALSLGSAPATAQEPGAIPLWVRQFGTAEHDFVADIADHPTGVYVAGGTAGTFPGESSAGGTDAFVGKNDLQGTTAWIYQFGSPAHDEVVAIEADESGVYFAGATEGLLPDQNAFGGTDAFVGKLDPDGNVLWTRQFGTPVHDVPHAVAVDASGLYVTGSSLYPSVAGGSAGVFLRKFEPDGAEVWTRQLEGSDVYDARAVAVDGSGVYVAGSAFLQKFDTGGNILWASEPWTRDVTAPGWPAAAAVAIDASGVYVAGTRGYGIGPCPDFFVWKHSLSGDLVWERESGPHACEEAFDMFVETSGVYVLTGSLNSTVLRAYDIAGEPAWMQHLFDSGLGRDSVVAVDWPRLYVSGVVPVPPDETIWDGWIAAFTLIADPLAALKGRLQLLEEELEARTQSLERELRAVTLIALVATTALVLLTSFAFVSPWLRKWRDKERPRWPQGLLRVRRSSLHSGSSRTAPDSSNHAPPALRRLPHIPPADRMIRLTTKERILLHLARLPRVPETAEAPVAMSQEGIASGVWIEPRHVAQYVDTLARDGLISIRTAHVQNGRQRRKVYELTDSGRRVAARLLARSKEEVVPVWDGEHIWDVRVGEIMEKMNHKVSVLELARHLAEAGVIDFAALGATPTSLTPPTAGSNSREPHNEEG